MSRSWPLTSFVADFTAGPPAVPGLSSVDLQSGPTALRALSTSRGRQYELDVVQAGTMTVDLTDTSEYLNPANATSPWNSGANSILPYRCVQFGAWWNATTKDTTGNILNAGNQPPGTNLFYDPSFEGATPGWIATVAGAPTYTVSTAQHFVGAQSLAVTFTATGDSVGVGLRMPSGNVYTMSLYVFVAAGHTVTATLKNFPGALGSTYATATSSSTGAWQRLTLTGTPSGPTSLVQLQVASGTFSTVVYLDAIQLELGAAASAFTATGPVWNPIYTGYIERYPQTWDSAGFRGVKPLQAVDALSPLSRAVINQSYAQTIMADNPQVYIPYDDAGFPQVVQRPTGGQPMIGYQQLGSNSSAVSFAGDTFLDGSNAVSLAQQNTSPATFFDNTQLTYLGTRQGGVAMNPQSFCWEQWVKFSSGCVYFGVGGMHPGESTVGEVVGTLSYLGGYTTGGAVAIIFQDGSTPVATPIFNSIASLNGGKNFYPDQKWHYISISLTGSNQFVYTLDGLDSTVHTMTSTPVGLQINNIFLEAQTYFGDPLAQISSSNLALYPVALTATQRRNHYQRGIGYLGEISGARALRLLTKYWSSNVIVGTGNVAMSTDFYYDPPVQPGTAAAPMQVLSALQDIATTESGLVWVDAAGVVHFDARDTRYINAPSAQFVFGEHTSAGELPYQPDLAYDYDPTYVYSEADLTGGSGNQLPAIVNTTAQANYGQRQLSTTLYMQNDWDVNQAGQFFVQRYAAPAGGRGSTAPMRIKSLTINPAENPSLWQAALSLDIGERVTVKRRTSPGTTISGDYYIEQVNHNVDAVASTWSVTYQLSPVFNPVAWVLGDATNGVLGSTTVCVY